MGPQVECKALAMARENKQGKHPIRTDICLINGCSAIVSTQGNNIVIVGVCDNGLQPGPTADVLKAAEEIAAQTDDPTLTP